MILFRAFSNQPIPLLWSMFFLKSSLSCLKVGQLQLVTAARGNRSGSGFEAELAAEQPAANFPTSCCSSSARPDFGQTGDESLRKAQLGCSKNSLFVGSNFAKHRGWVSRFRLFESVPWHLKQLEVKWPMKVVR